MSFKFHFPLSHDLSKALCNKCSHEITLKTSDISPVSKEDARRIKEYVSGLTATIKGDMIIIAPKGTQV